MRIAIPYENGQIYEHFGHTKQFKLYLVEQDQVAACAVVDVEGNGHEQIVEAVTKYHIDVIICGGIGQEAMNMLEENNIAVINGISGNADEVVKQFIQELLEYSKHASCSCDCDCDCGDDDESCGGCHGCSGCGGGCC